MPDIETQRLIRTDSVAIRDVVCQGTCRTVSAEEAATATHLVFTYRGVFVRHLGRDRAVGDANQALCFNAGEGYRISHPVPGGDSSLDLVLHDALLRELSPAAMLRDDPAVAFRRQHQPVDPRTQMLVTSLRHGLTHAVLDRLQAESLALALARRTLGAPRPLVAARGAARQRLVDRAKVLLASDLSRRWTLAEIAAQVGGSPVYLTQAFSLVEGVPLYRYQLRLRLARALDLLRDADDLTSLGLELGFSSHSHFTALFRETYGRTPSGLRADLRRRAGQQALKIPIAAPPSAMAY
jgi:AraC family transcriptional regulator